MVGIAAASLMALLVSCVQYARGRIRSSRSGTCAGVCQHYLDCKEDENQQSMTSCMAECREIYVNDGEPDRESLIEFEDLECKDAVAFVDGDDRGRNPTATRDRAKARSHAR